VVWVGVDGWGGRLDFFTSSARRHADGYAVGDAVLEEAFMDERDVF
jgi:hypothetical protein